MSKAPASLSTTKFHGFIKAHTTGRSFYPSFYAGGDSEAQICKDLSKQLDARGFVPSGFRVRLLSPTPADLADWKETYITL